MRKNNKGFTLIELLAIIVILAIIAVITVPIILNVIENSRKGAAIESANGFKDAVQKYYMSQLANNANLKLDGPYEVKANGVLKGNFGITEEDEERTIPVEGEKPSSGSLTYLNNVLTSGTLVIGNYTATYSNGSFTAVKTSVASNNNSGSESGQSGNGGNNQQSGGQENISYVYANDYSDAYITSVSDGSTERLSSTNNGDGVYLRYGVSNNELITPPDTCINDVTRSERGELCLAYGTANFANNTTLIKEYFNIDDNEIVNGSYTNETLECTFSTDESSCSDGSSWYVVSISDGWVEAKDLLNSFFCDVDSTSEYYCDGQ